LRARHIAEHLASGSVTASSDPHCCIGEPVRAKLTPGVADGQLLQMTINADQKLPFVRQHRGGNPPVRRLTVETIGGETAAVRSMAITEDIYGHTSDATTRAAIDGRSDALGLS
jgi:hypothetical protein